MKEQEIIAELSHSYFNHILREVRPFLEYFNDDFLDSSLTAPIDSELLERLFFMAAITSLDVSLPFNFSDSDVVKSHRKHRWLTSVQSFGSKSKQGIVGKSRLFNAFTVVVKRAKNSKFDEITMRDFCVGINLNKILRQAPFFVRTLGGFQHKNQFNIVTEFVDGRTLKTFLQSKRSSWMDFLNIFFQILLGLEIAQNRLNFSHYDLHTDNIILVPVERSFTVSLYGSNYTVKHDYRPVMIDFGLSSVHTKGKTLGQTNLENKGIFGHMSPGYDIYVFLLFCIDVVQSTNLSIYKGITDLLGFFNSKTNISMDLLTNNHIQSLEKGVSNLVPYQFISYIRDKFSPYLNVDIGPQKMSIDRCLGQKPMFLRLKHLLDRDDELEPLNSPLLKKGFVKTLVNNIKVYYWYREKMVLESDQTAQLIETDKEILDNLIDDLELKIVRKGSDKPQITVEQKNLFFMALEYYNFIRELRLEESSEFYKTWSKRFKKTWVCRNIFSQLDCVIREERLTKCPTAGATLEK
ncbi:hypothetical protein MIV098L [Invertebrate iridescent virus 3]|uniref:Probable kinase 098L n=1 Tax=Invertebrate iridescent virus 3 TaxID=345201 RepID=VF439_IIV3|nr:hypothetical protein MIV098L [Invertebrate iridescent virus 3]Q196W2.1 RecName: Full=Probable kinase 098L [Invertebrate iridescent virus 3]ABF82128.1 hypothetical protein MIV098L [Invertebrate iridescent virus 3]